jgi:hypothetical protein
MIDRSRIRLGMTVCSSDGEKLGKVIQCQGSTFIIEKGFLFPMDYALRVEDVSDVMGDEIRLSRGRALLGQLTELREVVSMSAYREDVKVTPVEEEEEEVEIPRRPEENEEARLRKERFVEQRAADEDVESSAGNFGEDSGAIGRRDPDDEA